MKAKSSIKTLRITAAAIIFTVVAAALAVLPGLRPALVLRDAGSGRVYARYAVADGQEFSVEFIHSVNQSPVRDVFAADGGRIRTVRTVYTAFGAGMPDALGPGLTLSYDDEGNMVVSGFEGRHRQLRYIVGTVSDHVLEIGGRRVSLRDLCGQNADVVLEISYTIFREE